MMKMMRIMILLRRKGRSILRSLCCPAAARPVMTKNRDLDCTAPCFLRLKLHEEWLERERLAQDEFRLRLEREEAAQKRREEEEVNYCLYSSCGA